MPDTPSELLTRAADLIRDRVVGTTPGPWGYEDSSMDLDGAVYQHPTGEEVAFVRSTSINVQDANGRWIALLNPSVAPAIESMLRDAAVSWRSLEWSHPEVVSSGKVDGWLRDIDRFALDFTLAVLGLVDPKEGK